MALIRAHLVVSGYVQGVFFRHSMAQRARTLDVGGWVRNLPDGRVEAVVEGEESEVRVIVDWCHTGPPHATVHGVEVEWETASREFSAFSTI